MKKLADCTKEECKVILEKNGKLVNLLYEICLEDTSMMIDEELDYFRHGKTGYSISDFEIAYYGHSFVTVKQDDYYDFIVDCYNKRGMLFDKENLELLDRLVNRVDLFREVLNGCEDMTDENWERFEAWFDSGVKKLADNLCGQWKSMYENVNKEYILDYFYEYFIETQDMDVDDDYIVWETVRKCYA